MFNFVVGRRQWDRQKWAAPSRNPVLVSWPVLLLALAVWLGCQSALSQVQSGERIGSLELSDIYLSPRFHYREDRVGHFELGESFVGFRWHRDQDVWVNILLG